MARPGRALLAAALVLQLLLQACCAASSGQLDAQARRSHDVVQERWRREAAEPNNPKTPEASTRVLGLNATSGTTTALPGAGAVQGQAQANSSTSSSTAKPVPGGKRVLVSTPIVPGEAPAPQQPGQQPTSSERPADKVHVWANATQAPRLAEEHSKDDHSKEQIEEEEKEEEEPLYDRYPAEVTNRTLSENHVMSAVNDSHTYYNSSVLVDASLGKRLWVELDSHEDIQVNQMLSQSHRRAATVKLKFDFPFYGHKVRNVTIATGGFLYTGEYVHSWLAATQYIAPLMANFDTTLSARSFVKYADNGTAFTVEWENVHLQDHPEAGAFTFQATLLRSGDILFVYKTVPVLVEDIEDKEHPVKIGLSDAYMMDRQVFFARRKTIYEYHRVNFQRQDIKNWTVIQLKALPTCLQADDCKACLTQVPGFECKWCPQLAKCSTGTFRFRQEWLQRGCDTRNVQEPAKCPARSILGGLNGPNGGGSVSRSQDGRPAGTLSAAAAAAADFNSKGQPQRDATPGMGMSGVVGLLLVVALVAGLAAWATYAYRYPHSASGQMLIRYRPSQWSWRRGEARYTAATIHM